MRLHTVLAQHGAPPANIRPSPRASLVGASGPLQPASVPPSVQQVNLLQARLFGWLNPFGASAKAAAHPRMDSSVVQEAAERGKAAAAAEQQDGAAMRVPANISAYLHPTGVLETRYVRLLSSLCSETYYMSRLTEAKLWRKHRFHLITTSRAVEVQRPELPRSPAQVLAEGDGMVASIQEVAEVQRDVPKASSSSSSQKAQGEQPANVAVLQRLDAALDGRPTAVPATQSPVSAPADAKAAEDAEAKQQRGPSPTDIVGQKLAAAAAAAVAAAAPLTSSVTSFTGAIAGRIPMAAMTSQLQSAAAAGSSTAVATIATVTAAVNSSWRRDAGKPATTRDPTQWFVADDPASHTRYFVIQGSETVDHWRVNLTFDPVPFEDAALGVRVHRGVYEAAELLYARFRPLVEEHLASGAFAKIAFTGHSLGGSLATLLMLMFLRRGVIPRVAISPVYTFGAPAVFCEGRGVLGLPDSSGQAGAVGGTASAGDCTACDGGGSDDCACAERQPEQQGGGSDARGVLQKLRLPVGAVRNVIMARDIVPRAFACDYTLVADLLRRVGDGFRDHPSLQGPERVVMYFFVGKLLVLQPDPKQTHVHVGEEEHDMLPPGPGLYTLKQPTAQAVLRGAAKKELNNIVAAANSRVARAAMAAAQLTEEAQQLASSLSGGKEAQGAVPSATTTSLARVRAALEAAVANKGLALGPEPPTLRDAMAELMNYPHPLETLAETSAYGHFGRIARFHDPVNYCKGLGGVLRAKTKPWRAMLLEGSKSGGIPWYVGLARKHRRIQLASARRGPSQAQFQERSMQRVNSCGSAMHADDSVLPLWSGSEQQHGSAAAM